jgi:ribosomal protein L29
MKRKDKTVVFENTVEELAKQAADIRGKIAQLKVDRFTKPPKNSREVKNLRQKLAVILTAITQKEMLHG